jgi:hypothetical protein
MSINVLLGKFSSTRKCKKSKGKRGKKVASKYSGSDWAAEDVNREAEL